MVQEPNPIGITMRVTNMTSTGCTLVFEQSGGNVTGQLQTGEPYDIQKMDSDGNWVSDIKTIVDWKDIAYSIKTNDTTEIDVEWQYVHGAFEPGHYRIKKDVMDFRETADYDTYEIYAEFDVGSPEDSYDEVWHTYNMNGAGNTESEKFTESTDFLPAEVIIKEMIICYCRFQKTRYNVPGLFCMPGESMGTVLFDSLNDVIRVMRLTHCEYGIYLLSFNQMIRGFL